MRVVDLLMQDLLWDLRLRVEEDQLPLPPPHLWSGHILGMGGMEMNPNFPPAVKRHFIECLSKMRTAIGLPGCEKSLLMTFIYPSSLKSNLC